MPITSRRLATFAIAVAAAGSVAPIASAQPPEVTTPVPAPTTEAPVEPGPSTGSEETTTPAVPAPSTEEGVAPSTEPAPPAEGETPPPAEGGTTPPAEGPLTVPLEVLEGQVACMFEDASVAVLPSQADADRIAEEKGVKILACATHPVDEPPAEGQPTEEPPAVQQPTEEPPADGLPTEEQPTEEPPLGDQPIEEQPIG
ncbi:hypothetical protein [Nocardia sp. NPDC019395]|uniref:hypothetical protein n=1 Tax=Nocardia sp. NPDC019395 TaxID=3154686 RepID=UPI0033F12AAF